MSDTLADVLDFMTQMRIRYDEVDGEGFRAAEEELSKYVQQHILRFTQTLRLLRAVFPVQSRPRVLDLGAAPYYLTAYLVDRWGWDIVPVSVQAGVWPGAGKPMTPRRVILEIGQRTLELSVSIFNIEKDRFPFDAAAFDAVLCLETIEHLGYSPSHMLTECHRVLKPDSILVITTPNSINILNTVRLLLNQSIAFPYSGYGFYGRHQREFTVDELRLLLEACHFKIARLDITNIARPVGKHQFLRAGYRALDMLTRIPLSYFQAKREHIMIVAQPFGEPLEAYPLPLYKLHRHLYNLQPNTPTTEEITQND